MEEAMVGRHQDQDQDQDQDHSMSEMEEAMVPHEGASVDIEYEVARMATSPIERIQKNDSEDSDVDSIYSISDLGDGFPERDASEKSVIDPNKTEQSSSENPCQDQDQDQDRDRGTEKTSRDANREIERHEHKSAATAQTKYERRANGEAALQTLELREAALYNEEEALEEEALSAQEDRRKAYETPYPDDEASHSILTLVLSPPTSLLNL